MTESANVSICFPLGNGPSVIPSLFLQSPCLSPVLPETTQITIRADLWRVQGRITTRCAYRAECFSVNSSSESLAGLSKRTQPDKSSNCLPRVRFRQVTGDSLEPPNKPQFRTAPISIPYTMSHEIDHLALREVIHDAVDRLCLELSEQSVTLTSEE